jgi:CheY-like chemotaxis protein
MFKKRVMRVAESWTVFLVDDDKDEAELYIEAIRESKLPIELHFFEGGENMLSRLRSRSHPHLIILDANLSGLSGLECLRRLKSKEEYKNIPVIICTSLQHQRTIEESVIEGALFCTTKPANFSGYQNLLNGFYKICSGKTDFIFGKTG